MKRNFINGLITGCLLMAVLWVFTNESNDGRVDAYSINSISNLPSDLTSINSLIEITANDLYNANEWYKTVKPQYANSLEKYIDELRGKMALLKAKKEDLEKQKSELTK